MLSGPTGNIAPGIRGFVVRPRVLDNYELKQPRVKFQNVLFDIV